MDTKTAVSALTALAQETRLSIFRLLIEAGAEGVAAGRIAEQLDVAAPTLSFHLKELHRAGLVSSRQESRFIYYAADVERMAALMAFLTHNCCRGMPDECLTIMETAWGRCCAPAKSRRRAGKP
jgi:DNA-binding transcriptional ArsR family regulator